MLEKFKFESFRSSRWFKPSLAIVGAIALLVVVLLVAPALIDINTYRGQIITQLERRLGRSVKLGAMRLRSLPSIRVEVADVVIGDDPQFAQSECVKARSVKLGIGLWSLPEGSPEVSGIELVEPAVTLIKAGEGRWNWGTLKPLQSSDQESSPAPFDLLARDGRFTLIDRSVNPAVEKTYTGVNVALDDFSSRQVFDFVIGLTIPGEKAGKVEVEGEAGPIDSQDGSRTPIDARVRMQDADLAGLESLLGVGARHAGRLTMDVRVKGKLAEGLKAEGEVKADQLRLVEGVEPARAPLEAEFALTAKSERKSAERSEISLAIDRCEVRLGKTKADVTGRVSRIPDDPFIDLQIKGDGMALDSLLESAYAFGFGPPPGTKASGAATVNLRASGDTRSTSLDGRLEIRDLKFRSSSMPQASKPIEVANADLSFTGDSLRVDNLAARLGSSQIDGWLQVKNFAQPVAAFDLKADQLSLAELRQTLASGQKPQSKSATAGSMRAEGQI